ncbi:uncharacterized protein M421DRAFT_101863 [Didymella exigua CBS 183.55]|uniref:polynucleotide adenylyltransferase n=1 Tax=Didymella exigua CBS 183.55 TaxID=1150837 RepID=A0A6A5RGL7_9PLEO|nr:uncharacterized protein M421DRAFT_101863 [Didymella exigua CBS 183.55]KAF1927471.1 hypothetical protein M421DRAFT_101863 [Didymella exigua CBS 183.55]
MSDRRHASAAYLYAPYPPATIIYLDHRQSLQPFLQLARIDEVHSHVSAATPSSTTAVIVSPHYSPPPEREEPRLLKQKPFVKTALARQQLDGPREQAYSVHTSAPKMTPNDLRNSNSTPSKRDDANTTPQRLQRPSIVSQHSNSVPSTPLQLARKYESHSRSPSPNGGLGSHSPRSVSSEANSTMPTLRVGRPFKCKYETNFGQLGRRRMPYKESELLNPADKVPKKALDPHEDDKLSGDMRELYDRLQPSVENTRKRDRFVQKVKQILDIEFPGSLFTVHVFGSSGNMLYTTDSDVDICIQTPMTSLEEMHPLAEALDKHGMQRVVCIPAAKVRIVKVWDPELELACDMNVNNVAALENTKMIRTYIQIDDRVRELAMIIKHWTKQRLINDAGIGGTISSYTWICLIINFLQTRNPPILPALHNFQETDGKGQMSRSGFADDIEKLQGFGDANKETVGQLLFQFFRLYGHEIDYEKEVISVRQGKRLSREDKGWHPGGGQKEGTNRLCVEEPFNIERNLGNSADDYAWRGLHLEIRRAFDLLADGQRLDKACEQYEFPEAQQPNPLMFQKPTSKPAILTSSVPIRSSRGGSNHRGGRGGFNMKGQHNNGSRRSSGSQPFTQGRPGFLHSPPIQHGPGQEYFAVPRGIHDQLHDQLFQQYQMLEMQSNSLRAQLAAQQHAQQAHRAAQMHAHAVAQAQAQHYAPNGSNGSPQKSSYINGRLSPRLAELGIPPNALPQGFMYPYPGFFSTQHPGTGPQDSVRTNPSSPSLSTSMPGARRVVHRASNASDTSVNRSQSQPARGIPQQPVLASYPPMPQFYDPAAFSGYPIARSSQDTPETQSASDTQSSPPSHNVEPAGSPFYTTPKEYLGYYNAEQPPVRSLQEYAVGAIPSFSELKQRRTRVSPEITQPLLNTALRRVSRSPSPLRGHVRNDSIGPALILPGSDKRKARVDSVRPSSDLGPVIANGSFPTPSRDQLRGDMVETPTTTENLGSSIIGVYASQPTLQQNTQQQIRELQARQQLVLEEMQRQSAANVTSSPIVNGSAKVSSPVDVNGLIRMPGEDRQPFPDVSDDIINYDAKKERPTHIEDASPKRDLPPWRATALPNGLSLDTTNAPRAPPQEIKTANIPLLSPVFEKRTPSPTANRPADSKATNGTKSQSKEYHQQGRRASLPKQSTQSKDNSRGVQQKSNDKNQKPGSSTTNAGPWQNSQGRRKGKGRKKTPEQKSTGELLPTNVSERKGG